MWRPRRVGPLAYRPAHERRPGRSRSPASSGLSPEETALEGAAPAGPSLSPSRAADFMTCPLLYRFRVVDRLPEAPSPAATRGTVVHSVLERLFDLPAAERTLDAGARAGRSAVGRSCSRPSPSSPRCSSERAGGDAPATATACPASCRRRRRCSTTYFALEDPHRLEPAERELHVEVELDSGLAAARLRRPARRRRRPGRCGSSTTRPAARPRPGFEAKAHVPDALLRAGAVAARRASCRALLQLLYLGSGEVLRYEPDEADLRATELKVQALWAAIERATETRRLAAEPVAAVRLVRPPGDCCPAWGGTAAAADGRRAPRPRAGAARPRPGSSPPSDVPHDRQRPARAVGAHQGLRRGRHPRRRARRCPSTSSAGGFTAIMGPSGSGKSTLDALPGRPRHGRPPGRSSSATPT